MSVVAVAGVTAQAVAELKAVEQASIQARIELIIKIARVVPWRMPFLRGGRRHTATDKTPQTIVPVDCTEPFGRGKLAPLYIRVRENGVGKFCFCFPNARAHQSWAGVGGLKSSSI